MMDAASNQPSDKMRQLFSCGAILLLVISGIGPVTGMARDLDLSDPEDAMETEEYALYREPPPPDDTRPMTDEYATYREIQTGEAGDTEIRGQ